MPEFHLTVMGHRFYESTMPSLVRAVESLNKKLDTLAEGAQANQLEDERMAAAFAMREVIVHDLTTSFPDATFRVSIERIISIIRQIELPPHAPETPGAEQEGR